MSNALLVSNRNMASCACMSWSAITETLLAIEGAHAPPSSRLCFKMFRRHASVHIAWNSQPWSRMGRYSLLMIRTPRMECSIMATRRKIPQLLADAPICQPRARRSKPAKPVPGASARKLANETPTSRATSSHRIRSKVEARVAKRKEPVM